MRKAAEPYLRQYRRLRSVLYRNVANIIIFIYAQKLTATDRYSSSYGPAKFDVAMASFGVKTRRAITFSISVFSYHIIIHQNVDNYVVYYRVNRDVDTMTESYQNTVQNSGVLVYKNKVL